MLFTFFAFLYFFFCAQASLREVPAAEKKHAEEERRDHEHLENNKPNANKCRRIPARAGMLS